ncbi:hypothetical protein KBX18_01465 [Corynebacterium sp. CCUG 69979]|uniref:hypothetical protein n=1 Tax=Corynebacterium sp. CCUG 69979 TaxID=2823890 RepID=UPI00210B7FF8|nr:hypothetical protein [Corynebacterium sp. CCUG 69979]MCQ4624238.1 hypothetical protein [Corynebacterium sp. CCUG 69979]
MKRTIGVLLAASALFLAGCSDSSEPVQETSAEVTSTDSSEPEFAKVGDTIAVHCFGAECQGEFEVEEILLGVECKQQMVEEDIPEDMQLVQISGILTATEKFADDQGVELGVTPENIEVWDSQSFRDRKVEV